MSRFLWYYKLNCLSFLYICVILVSQVWLFIIPVKGFIQSYNTLHFHHIFHEHKVFHLLFLCEVYILKVPCFQ